MITQSLPFVRYNIRFMGSNENMSEKEILMRTGSKLNMFIVNVRLRGHKSETISLLISISLSVKEYIEEE